MTSLTKKIYQIKIKFDKLIFVILKAFLYYTSYLLCIEFHQTTEYYNFLTVANKITNISGTEFELFK